MKEFKGKTAVVTGGASGIGRGLVEKFIELGMNVVVADIEASALNKVVSELASRQASVMGQITNTMRRESIKELLAAAVEAFGPVHILCNNAGVGAGTAPTPVWKTPDEDWTWVMGVNFWGVLYGIQVFVPHMLDHGEPAHIVNTASLAGLMPGGGPYSVSKHAVLATTEGLYSTFKHMNANISASVLCPGMVNTGIWNAERNRPGDLAAGELYEQGARMLKATLEKGKKPSEIADSVHRSIVEDRLYILPHPAWDDLVRSRVEHILARRGPLVVDWSELEKRRDQGEVF